MIRCLFLAVALGAAVGLGAASAASADTPVNPDGSLTTATANEGVTVSADTFTVPSGPSDTEGDQKKPIAIGVTALQALEFRASLGCGDTSSPEATVDVTDCTLAMSACGDNAILLYVWARRVGSEEPWQFKGQTCKASDLPAGTVMPPAIPTLAQIQNAFRQLPFSKPSVGIEPEGNKTLVNLPTYFRAEWPGDAGLQPGEVSTPVQLLTWSVEFRIAARSYDFHYGDGSSSGPTSDPGGVYPDGAIRHTYTEPTAGARVSVDAQLTAQYRANGGPWQDIDSVADLQDEPVTTLQVREAHARLVTH